jgi:hypothetical protein
MQIPDKVKMWKIARHDAHEPFREFFGYTDKVCPLSPLQ